MSDKVMGHLHLSDMAPQQTEVLGGKRNDVTHRGQRSRQVRGTFAQDQLPLTDAKEHVT
jgi:hypothetical protein